ncbi:hypothetical protein AVEN_134472-1 [Araneus ventricosus]|uniref:Uncharacterized protein n=1 Tax=Araneus ventricosus TaxID=182803 RepID=A0A4Y2REU4_ARAVE|nr:hypothetical protein AVEN_134472-1 [Araneus ventricosus]
MKKYDIQVADISLYLSMLKRKAGTTENEESEWVSEFKALLPLDLAQDTSTHSEFEADFEAAESYPDGYLELKTKVEASLKSSRGLMKCSSMDNFTETQVA